MWAGHIRNACRGKMADFGQKRFQQKVLAAPGFELGAFCFLPLRFFLSTTVKGQSRPAENYAHLMFLTQEPRFS
jgi:hypothetical protein